ncbi:MAG: protein-glutamate O-methyltransferase CheR [Phycisphaerae bacterium]|nr:protein-glutamate O-methyltransferase CheR [Gemmatimonadaceae bacterium]
MAPADYSFLVSLLRKQTGISLTDDKAYLLESRLIPLATSLGHADLPTLVHELRKNPGAILAHRVCDAMTTNETLFFRDTAPFTALSDHLLPAASERARTEGRAVRIWSAACATGQEAYSMSMTAESLAAKLGDVAVEILATDFSPTALARARAGTYSQFEVQRGLPINNLLRYFRESSDGFTVSDELKRRIKFSEVNLLHDFSHHGKFDIVFIRNVLIYFDVSAKQDVLERIARQLHPGGTVVLGGTETTLGITSKLTRHATLVAPVYVAADSLEMFRAARAQ